jgi:hypothetical protein
MPKMRKKKVASLTGIGRQIGNVEKALRKARSKTTPAGRRELNMQLKELADIKADLRNVCRTVWFVEIPLPMRGER